MNCAFIWHGKTRIIVAALILVLPMLVACGGNDVPNRQAPNDPLLLGYTTVPLDVNKLVVRRTEAPVGNMVADAMAERLNAAGFNVDGACINGGNLRFNIGVHPDGITPAGELHRGDIDNILPFVNFVVVLKLTGAQLRSTFERSVAQLPSASPAGAFLQLSQALRLQFDLSKPAQLIDTSVIPNVILQEGQRIVFLSVHGMPVQDNALYSIAFTDFNAGGGDGFIALATAVGPLRTDAGVLLADMVAEHIQLFTPVSPQVEGRIVNVTPLPLIQTKNDLSFPARIASQ